ncbi:MAG: stage III sporulation protein SpoIIIAB [Bacillota bacterium]|nr:stage III sporulation protein SpoIIIAB [Bacillota bacterium]
MILKMIACSVVLFSATAAGFVIAGRFSGRVRDLRLIQEGLKMMESEILFTSTQLPEALLNTSAKLEAPLDRVFVHAAQILEGRMGYTAGEAWNLAFEKYLEALCFNKEDLEIIRDFGKSLGSTDKANQEKNFRLARLQISSQQVKAEEDRGRNERMYKNLGFLLGVTIIILLI